MLEEMHLKLKSFCENHLSKTIKKKKKLFFINIYTATIVSAPDQCDPDILCIKVNPVECDTSRVILVESGRAAVTGYPD